MDNAMATFTQSQRSDLVPASRKRRAIAFFVDLMLTIGISQVAMTPVALLLPPDRSGPASAAIGFGAIVGLAYLGFSYLAWGNTLGKHLFGLSLISVDERPISAQRLLLRAFTLGLLPLHAVMVLLSGRHLGDRLARTVVLVSKRPPSRWPAFGAALVVVFGAYWAGNIGMRVSVLNTQVWAVARAHLANLEGEQSALPMGFQLINDNAVFDTRQGDTYRRVRLQRQAGVWQVLDSQVVPTPATGTTIRFGAETTSFAE
jgi:uncharacterized RDD family membrane protein YckC